MARIGLVLGAGGAVGEGFHAGVLAALAEVTGYDPRGAEVVVGTSAGSVVAAALRAGLGADDIYSRAVGGPLSEPTRRIFGALPAPSEETEHMSARRRRGPSSPELIGRLFARPQNFRPAMALAAVLPEGRRDATAWFAGFDVVFPDGSWPEKSLWICAVSLDQGRLTVFGRDAVDGLPRIRVSQAVQASCAIPAVFSPLRLGGRRYVDGGVHSPTNADLLAGEGLDAVIVSSPMSMGGRAENRSARGLLAASRLPAGRALQRELALLGAEHLPVLCFEPSAELVSLMGYQGMDFSRRAPVAERTYALATEALSSQAAREVRSILTDS